MPDPRQEKLLVEAMKNLLDQDELGRVDSDYEEHAHNTQFQWEDIQRDFALAVKDSEHFDALCAAFYKVHSYKWINDSTFEEAMVSELESQGVPHEDIQSALDGLDKMRKEYLGGKGNENNENAVGWNDDMEGLKQVTQDPKNPEINPLDKDTMSGDNEPHNGAEPDNVRPAHNEA